MSFFGRRDRAMTLDEELAVAVRLCTMRQFATLPEDEQYVGYRRLATALAIYADELEEGVL